MTTAHRATWHAALHEASDKGNWKGARSAQMPARDMPNHLKMKYRSGDQLPPKIEPRPELLATTEPDADEVRRKYDDADDADSDDDDESDEEDSEDSDDDDDELAVARELEKIKREREEERRRLEAQSLADAKAARDSAALTANPLLNGTAAVKREWNDDVVFKNQARDDKTTKKRFINDTIRNDFHKRFLQKYIQ